MASLGDRNRDAAPPTEAGRSVCASANRRVVSIAAIVQRPSTMPSFSTVHAAVQPILIRRMVDQDDRRLLKAKFYDSRRGLPRCQVFRTSVRLADAQRGW